MRRTWLWPALVAALIVVLPGSAFGAGSINRAQALARLEAETVRIRHLTQLRPVRTEFPSNAGFNAAYQHELSIDDPESEIQLGQREDRLLGLIGPNDDLHRIFFQGIAAQVAGFYDFHNKVLYIRSYGDAVTGPQRWIIAHEYTHALQDEHYNLARFVPDETKVTYRNSDLANAHHAMIEGDAVQTQDLFIFRTYTAADITGLEYVQAHLPKSPPVPAAIERYFNFPYTAGLDFVRTLYNRGGFAAVDQAYARPPASTFEIMHPQAYLAHWKPEKVTIHSVQGLSDWQQTDDDVMGAFGYMVMLWQWLDKSTASSVTDTYRGDRYLFLQKGPQSAMLLRSMWTTNGAAHVAQQAFLKALRLRFPHATVTHTVGMLVTQAGGAEMLRVTNRALTMTYAPDAQTATALATAPTG